MGLFNKLFNEFIDIIEWVDDTSDTIVWRFPRYQSEIKNGAQLTVRESQVAVLINEGQLADIYQPGRYELTTQNMPILTTLKGWKYGFNSPFKVDVYFINTKQFTNQKWGTTNPIMLRDPEFGPIRLRAYGSYCFKIDTDPTKFLGSLVGTDGNFTTDEVSDHLRNFINTKFSDYLAESKVAALDLASNLNEFSDALAESLTTDFADYGIKLTKFLVENISMPDAVMEAMDRSSSMKIIGDMNKYTQMQFADSLKEGAGVGGSGMAGDAMGMGMGMTMAQQMAQQMQQQQQQMAQQQQQMPPQQMTPPPMPPQQNFFVAVNGAQQGPFTMPQLQQLVQQGQLTPTTLVWTQGMPGWAAANTVQALAALFMPNTPPPIPPAL